jgi:hypothetical protein
MAYVNLTPLLKLSSISRMKIDRSGLGRRTCYTCIASR